MKSIRFSLLGASAASALVCLSHAAPATFAPQEAVVEATAEPAACQCTCAVCAAKHGAKPVGLTDVTEAEAPAPKAVPQLGVDIDSEVARILATELEEVDRLLVDVTNAVEAKEAAMESGTFFVFTPDDPAAADERGYMGISLNMDPDAGGAFVYTVTPGSPAAKAGLQVGDVITAAEEMPVESAEELIAVLVDLKVGDTAVLEYERGHEEKKVSIVLASRGSVDAMVGREVILARPAGLAEEPIIEEFEPPIGEDVIEEEPILIDVEVEEEVEVVLPAVNARLRGLGYVGDGGVAVIEDVEEVEPPAPRRVRWITKVEESTQERDADALPEGYIEIETRRERRPASDAALRERVQQLEEEVAELARIVEKLRSELDRRNPR